MKPFEWTRDDLEFMQQALRLAEKGRGAVSPNPMVGCIMVKNGKKIGAGYHRGFGLPHAEVEAFKEALTRENSFEGSTVYVTLEPCCHSGENKKTPPCVPYLIESGVKRVVIAMLDPNPEVAGRSVRMLKRAGITVDVGCLQSQSQELNKGFCTWITKNRPYVSVKVAASLDGKIATKSGDSKWITSPESRKLVYELRDLSDAILVGKGTVLADNPHLKGHTTEPLRVILDSTLKTPLASHVYETGKVIVMSTPQASPAKIATFNKHGIEVCILPELTVKRVLKELAQRGVTSVFVEGGSSVFGSFFDSDSADCIYWFTAPLIIGGASALGAVGGEGVRMLKNAHRYTIESCAQVDGDLLTTLVRTAENHERDRRSS